MLKSGTQSQFGDALFTHLFEDDAALGVWQGVMQGR
jgi:hypothetical protein